MQAALQLQTAPAVKLNSPFRYPGGKFYARPLILRMLPEHDHYCEPFAGGGSIFFAKPKSGMSILNDLDNGVVNTLVHIRDNVEGLIELLAGLPASKELHSYYKNEYEPRIELEQAFRWYYLNRTSYSGIMKPENCYWGYGDKYSMRPENWPAHLRAVSEKLQDVQIVSCDFEQLVDDLPEGFFLFVDPPYFNADQQKFYNCAFTFDDHVRLARCLRRNADRLQFLLTYDDHPGVHDLYQWTSQITSQQWNYTINRTDDQKKGLKKDDGFKSVRQKGQELFIQNYHD